MMLAALPHSPIKRLILNDVGPQIPIFGLKRIAKYADTTREFKSIDEAKEHFKLNYAQFGPLTEKQWDTFTANSIEQRANHIYIAKVDPGVKNPKSTLQIISEFFHQPQKALEGILYDIDLWPIWQKVKCPVLVIHGAHSDLLTTAIIQRMQRVHDKTQVYTVEDAGHAPALLNKTDHVVIEDWLNSDL